MQLSMPNKLLHATRETRARKQWRWAYETMRIAVIALGLLSPVASVVADPIDTLTRRLNDNAASHGGLWINGSYPFIHLPAGASTSDVLEEAIKTAGFSEGHIQRYSILTTRVVILSASAPSSIKPYCLTQISGGRFS